MLPFPLATFAFASFAIVFTFLNFSIQTFASCLCYPLCICILNEMNRKWKRFCKGRCFYSYLKLNFILKLRTHSLPWQWKQVFYISKAGKQMWSFSLPPKQPFLFTIVLCFNSYLNCAFFCYSPSGLWPIHLPLAFAMQEQRLSFLFILLWTKIRIMTFFLN